MSVIPPPRGPGDRAQNSGSDDGDPSAARGGPEPRRSGVRALAGTLADYSALALGGVLAMVAMATPASAAVYGAAFAATVVVGPAVMVWLRQGGSDRWSVALAGGIATAAVLGLFLVVAGVIAVFGQASAVVLPLIVIAAAVRLDARRDPLGRIRSAADRTGVRLRRWFVRESAGPADRIPSSDPDAGTVVAPERGDRPTFFSDAGEVSTGALCRAWHDSYWLLTESAPGAARNDLVVVRSLVLDELERRDPSGFRDWLDSGPRAGSDPRRHLGRGPAGLPRDGRRA